MKKKEIEEERVILPVHMRDSKINLIDFMKLAKKKDTIVLSYKDNYSDEAEELVNFITKGAGWKTVKVQNGIKTRDRYGEEISVTHHTLRKEWKFKLEQIGLNLD